MAIWPLPNIKFESLPMDPALQAFLTGLPTFLLQGGTALAIWSLGLWIYIAITPHDEVALVRGGNVAAGLSLGAAAIGIAIPIAATLATSHSMLDLLIWGVTALTLQLFTFLGVDFLVKGLAQRIKSGEMGAASVLVGVKLGTALITAAALMG